MYVSLNVFYYVCLQHVIKIRIENSNVILKDDQKI
jgi:hypothetical protein